MRTCTGCGATIVRFCGCKVSKPKSIEPDCSGAEAGQSGWSPSVPGDSLRKIRDISRLITEASEGNNFWSIYHLADMIRELCSNENRSGKET